MLVNIVEIFKSIQGESSFSGFPCAFVRLGQCNLRCKYCDTTYAYERHKPQEIDTIVDQVLIMECNLVQITGGEPLLQEGVYPLIEKLLSARCEILVETNGSMDLSKLTSCRKGDSLHIIMDIKTPGSNESDNIHWENIPLLEKGDEIKFIIRDRTDYNWSLKILRRFHLSDKHVVHFSPAFNGLSPVDLTRWILEDRLNVRLNLQLHKYIWGESKQGV